MLQSSSIIEGTPLRHFIHRKVSSLSAILLREFCVCLVVVQGSPLFCITSQHGGHGVEVCHYYSRLKTLIITFAHSQGGLRRPILTVWPTTRLPKNHFSRNQKSEAHACKMH